MNTEDNCDVVSYQAVGTLGCVETLHPTLVQALCDLAIFSRSIGEPLGILKRYANPKCAVMYPIRFLLDKGGDSLNG